MIEILDIAVRPLHAVAAVIYLVLAMRVGRASPQHANSVIAVFLVLVGLMAAGTAFSYGTQDPNLYGIGRVLSFFATGFMPIAFYVVYRDYTVGPPHPLRLISPPPYGCTWTPAASILPRVSGWPSMATASRGATARTLQPPESNSSSGTSMRS